MGAGGGGGLCVLKTLIWSVYFVFVSFFSLQNPFPVKISELGIVDCERSVTQTYGRVRLYFYHNIIFLIQPVEKL